MQSVDDVLGLLGPSPQDQDAARRQGILFASLGLLGAPKGGEWAAIGKAGQQGLLARQQFLDNAQAQKLHAMQLRETALDYLNKQFQYNDAELLRQQQMEAARRFAPGGLQPTLGTMPTATAGTPATMPDAPGFGMNDRGIGPNPRTSLQPPAMLESLPGPTASNAGGQGGAPGGMPDRRQMAARLSAIGDYWSSVGRMQQADTYYKAAQAAMPQLKDQKVYTQNGQRVVVNVYNDGSTEVAPYGPDQEKAHFANLGNRTVALDPITGQPVAGAPAYAMGQSPDSAASNQITMRGQNMTDARAREGLQIRAAEADPFGMLGINKNPVSLGNAGPGGTNAGTVSGDALLQSLPKPIADQVRALAEGRMNFPGGFALKSPYWQNMISLVSQYDPSFDAVNYGARSKTRNDFTAGKSAQQANALNTVIGHLGQLSDAADSLKNTSFPYYNTAANFLAKQTGDPRINQFNITRKAVVDELTRVYRGTGGSEKDIETWTQ
jgi:hypothetical protein